MEHRRAIELLPDLTAEPLSSAERAELYRHLAECAECAAWVETGNLVTRALSDGAWPDHPTADLLAQSAVDAAFLSPAKRRSLDSHLAECAACREARDLSSAALSAARGPAVADQRGWPLLTGARSRLALAAALILGLALLFVLRSSPPPGPGEMAASGPLAAPAERASGAVGQPVSAPERVAALGAGDISIASSDAVSGIRLIDASRSISAGDVQIESGSDVIFRAGEAVVLGEGFAVGSNATLAIEIDAVRGPAASAEGT